MTECISLYDETSPYLKSSSLTSALMGRTMLYCCCCWYCCCCQCLSHPASADGAHCCWLFIKILQLHFKMQSRAGGMATT